MNTEIIIQFKIPLSKTVSKSTSLKILNRKKCSKKDPQLSTEITKNKYIFYLYITNNSKQQH